MQFKFLFTFSVLTFTAVCFLGNSNGRATASNAGNTGAPGDEAQPNGTPITCQGCHNSGSFSPTVTLQLLNTAGQSLSGYNPGDEYIAKLTFNTATAPKGYGFQMLALKNADNKNTGTFIDMGTNNYKLKTIASSSRTYAEHAGISLVKTFEVRWKAPAAGTGKVTIYAGGNAVNSDGTFGGDGAANTKLILNEGFSVASKELEKEKINLAGFPNPIENSTRVSLNLEQPGDFHLTVFDLAGHLTFEKNIKLSAGGNQIELDLKDWKSGVYLLNLSDENLRGNLKLLKL